MPAPPPHPVVYKYDDRYKDKDGNTLGLILKAPPQLPPHTLQLTTIPLQSHTRPPSMRVTDEPHPHPPIKGSGLIDAQIKNTMSEMDPPAPMVHSEAGGQYGKGHDMAQKARMSVAQRRQLRIANRHKQGCAMRGYETFHMLPAKSATIAQVRMSSGGMSCYADYDHVSSMECKQLGSF